MTSRDPNGAGDRDMGQLGFLYNTAQTHMYTCAMSVYISGPELSL